jgi:hypothetical protein
MEFGKMKMKELVSFYNQNTQGKKITKFESREIAIKRIQDLLKVTNRPEHKAKSKMGMIREMFAEQGTWKKQEIMDRVGFDFRNTNAAMNVLKNPTRTKSPLATEYDRKSQTYRLVKA